MSSDWKDSFHYDYFRELLHAAKDNFSIFLMKEAPQVLAAGTKPALILRHDLDISLKRALPLGEIEKRLGVSATYMVLVDSPVYDLSSGESQEILKDLMNMGHEVALHFSAKANPGTDISDWNEIERQVLEAKAHLEDIIQCEVASISFHRPITRFLRGPLWIFNLVNAYSAELMDWYLSDSAGRWREEPLPQMLQPRKPLLQLLIHPIWWGINHLKAEDRLEEFFQSETFSLSSAARDCFDRGLASTLGIRRRGLIGCIPQKDRGGNL